MALKLSPREISRQLANSKLTRSDCVQLRPMAVQTTFTIQELTACDYPKMVSADHANDTLKDVRAAMGLNYR